MWFSKEVVKQYHDLLKTNDSTSYFLSCLNNDLVFTDARKEKVEKQ